MIARENLNYLLESEDGFTSNELNGKLAILARGHQYYGRLKKIYPKHWRAFAALHQRIKVSGLPTDFEYSPQGFINFLMEIGDIPIAMKLPSVGRYRHELGYIKSNFRWQEHAENSIDRVFGTSSSIKSKYLDLIISQLTSDISLKDLNDLVGYSRLDSLKRILSKKYVVTDNILRI